MKLNTVRKQSRSAIKVIGKQWTGTGAIKSQIKMAKDCKQPLYTETVISYSVFLPVYNINKVHRMFENKDFPFR